METLRSSKGLAHGHMLRRSSKLLLSSCSCVSLRKVGKRTEGTVGGQEQGSSASSGLCPARAPTFPTAHGCGKTCQTSPHARAKWQSPELQGFGWVGYRHQDGGGAGRMRTDSSSVCQLGHTGTAPGPGWVLTAEALCHLASGTARTHQASYPQQARGLPSVSLPPLETQHVSCQCHQGRGPGIYLRNTAGGREM